MFRAHCDRVHNVIACEVVCDAMRSRAMHECDEMLATRRCMVLRTRISTPPQISSENHLGGPVLLAHAAISLPRTPQISQGFARVVHGFGRCVYASASSNSVIQKNLTGAVSMYTPQGLLLRVAPRWAPASSPVGCASTRRNRSTPTHSSGQ